MSSVNRLILIGNLTRDPALKYLANQTAVCEFGIATNRRYKTAGGEQRDEPMFIDCSVFGKPAEVINQYCQKGKQLYVEGRLSYQTWESKDGGGKRSKHICIVENFQFLGSKDANDRQHDEQPAAVGGDDQRPLAIDDIPF